MSDPSSAHNNLCTYPEKHHTCRRAFIIVRSIPVRDDEIAELDASGQLGLQDVDLVEEQDQTRLGE